MPAAPEFEPLGGTLLFPTPTPGVAEIEPAMAWNAAVVAGVGVPRDAEGMFFAMHAYLRECGVDGVKVDCQGAVGLVGGSVGGGGGPALTRRYHAAFEASVRAHFGGNHCINCMCHSTENLYRMADTAVARVSDDFYPRDPASTTPHVAACAYNSLFMAPLVHPDWDMFTSSHGAAELHAMARAVSGSAVYVSDKPGEHDFALLARIVLPGGSVLRAHNAARPTRDCLFDDVLRDGASLLKAWNRNAVTGVVGVFHLQVCVCLCSHAVCLIDSLIG
jgi:raffinose synthase